MHDYTTADLDPQTRGILDYAAKLTREPWSVREEDVVALRDLGLTDEQVLAVVLIVCYYSFLTRIADGLGIDIEGRIAEEVQSWLAGPAKEQDWLVKRHG
jgi:alkylhydroperoxidase family enzyme